MGSDMSGFDTYLNLIRELQDPAQKAEAEILRAADDALRRLEERRNEDPDEWAQRLAPTFFADLDRKP